MHILKVHAANNAILSKPVTFTGRPSSEQLQRLSDAFDSDSDDKVVPENTLAFKHSGNLASTALEFLKGISDSFRIANSALKASRQTSQNGKSEFKFTTHTIETFLKPGA